MQVTKKVYLIARPGNTYNAHTSAYEECVTFEVWPYEKYGDVPAITDLEVTFEVPGGLNSKDLKLAELEAERTKLLAEFNNRITQIQRQINELTAIEGYTGLIGEDLDIPF